MTRDEKLAALAIELQTYLQNVFNEYVDLRTWAKVWAAEDYDLDLGAFEEIQDVVDAMGFSNLQATIMDGQTPWEAVLSVSCSLDLHNANFDIEMALHNGVVRSIGVKAGNSSEELWQTDLAKAFNKKQTWVALKG